MLICLAAALGLVFQAARRARKPTMLSVPQIGRLAAAGRFDEASERVEAALKVDPHNGLLRVMAAQLALDRPDPQPDRALALLAPFRSADPVVAAGARLAEGKAAFALLDCARAESCWLEALRLDPRVPEAAWALLELYYLEGRWEEARRLALRQHEIEPDPHDRVQFLLELVRQDAEPPEPGSLAARFGPVVRAHPDDRRALLALGLALVRNSQADAGLALLDDGTRRWPESRDAWDALLTGLDAAGQPERLAAAWDRVPRQCRDDDRLARHAAHAAWSRLDWAGAARAYRRAWDARPDDLTSAYRLARALRALGQHEQAAPSDRFVREAQAAQAETLDLYKQADATQDLGLRPHVRLSQRLADNRQCLGRLDEARAWHRLVLRDRPDDLYSRTALERLQSLESQRGCDAPPEHGAARDGRGIVPAQNQLGLHRHDD
jgi:tetratricopeptide (TPR) repeat protein